VTKTKSSYLLAALISTLALTTWAATPGGGNRGDMRGGPGAGAPQGGRGNRGANAAPAGLGQAMTDMDRNYRAIKADAADPTKQEAVVRNIDTMIRDVAIAKMQVPPTVRRLDAAKQPEALKSYNAMMVNLLKTLIDLEESVNDKKVDDIKKNIATIEEIQQKGHAEFMPQG
jgi:hypothetical protein